MSNTVLIGGGADDLIKRIEILEEKLKEFDEKIEMLLPTLRNGAHVSKFKLPPKK